MRRWRLALCVAIFGLGAMTATWVTRTPAIRDDVHASIAEMGGLLFGISIGAMVGVLGSRPLALRIGVRRVTAAGVSLGTVGCLGVAAGSAFGSAATAVVGFAMFGLGMGLADIALNIGAAAIESITDTHVLPLLHGSFSLGTVGGACLGIGASAMAIPVWIHLGIVAVLGWLMTIATLRWMPSDTTRQRRPPISDTPGRRPAWRDRSLMALGFIVLAIAMSEGAANDWLPLIFVDGYGLDEARGALLYTAFAVAMTIGRFSGGPLLTWFGHAHVIRGAVVIAIAGVLLVVVAPNPAVGVAAVVFWGLGASLGFPVTISAAGKHPHDGEARVALVSTAAYFAFLVGPPALGFAGEHVGLRAAMLILVAVLGAALLCTLGRWTATAATDSGPAVDVDRGARP